MRKLRFGLILFFSCTICVSEVVAQETIVKDFNKDRSFDFLVSGMEWEGFDSWDYVLTDGRTGEKWGYANSIDYFGLGSFFSIGKIRNELDESWDPYLRKMMDSLLVLSEPDPSLEWALNSTVIDLDNQDLNLFDHIFIYEKKWFQGTPYVPANYTCQLMNEVAIWVEEPDSLETFFINYRSHNHWERVSEMEKREFEIGKEGILKTKHALIDIRDDKYAWLFISGFGHTGGPSKLRWSSMEELVEYDGLVFLQQKIVVGGTSFWVGDIERGIWARIADAPSEQGSFWIEDEVLYLADFAKTVKRGIAIEDIHESLASIKLD
jgi:hypothetical protein